MEKLARPTEGKAVGAEAREAIARWLKRVEEGGPYLAALLSQTGKDALVKATAAVLASAKAGEEAVAALMGWGTAVDAFRRWSAEEADAGLRKR